MSGVPVCPSLLGALAVSAVLALAAPAGAQAPPAVPAPALSRAPQTLSRTPPVRLAGPSPAHRSPVAAPTLRAPALRTLPRTGFDLRWVVLAGGVLLLGGIGLRLRTGDVRRP